MELCVCIWQRQLFGEGLQVYIAKAGARGDSWKGIPDRKLPPPHTEFSFLPYRDSSRLVTKIVNPDFAQTILSLLFKLSFVPAS